MQLTLHCNFALPSRSFQASALTEIVELGILILIGCGSNKQDHLFLCRRVGNPSKKPDKKGNEDSFLRLLSSSAVGLPRSPQ